MTVPKTILVVDDAALVRLYYRSCLAAGGYQVAEAFNGVEALEKMATLTPDLLIVDVNMPQMDGLTLVDTLRGQADALAGTPVLIISSASAASDFVAARAAGANYYLVKPIEGAALLETVAILCGVPP